MPYGPSTALPIETEQAAHAIFSNNHPYIILGTRVNQLLEDLPLENLMPLAETSSYMMALIAMMTVLEYMEKLTDDQAAEACRMRVEWKYALHLPLVFPAIVPDRLCDFRSGLRLSTVASQVFQDILDRLLESEILSRYVKLPETTGQVIFELCNRNRVMNVGQAMSATIEDAALCQPDWLRATILPHWVERYGRTSFRQILQQQANETLEDHACSIGRDIQYFLEAISNSGIDCLTASPQNQELREIFRQQYCDNQGEVRWLVNGCARCSSLLMHPPITQEVP